MACECTIEQPALKKTIESNIKKRKMNKLFALLILLFPYTLLTAQIDDVSISEDRTARKHRRHEPMVDYVREYDVFNATDNTIMVTVRLPYGYYKDCVNENSNFVITGYESKEVEIAPHEEARVVISVNNLMLRTKKGCGGISGKKPELSYKSISTPQNNIVPQNNTVVENSSPPVNTPPVNTQNTNPNVNSDNNDEKPKVWAVIVGISDYPGTIDDLTYCDDDAKSIYNFLKSPQGGQIPDNQITLLVDQNATFNNITSSAEKIYAQAGKNDLLLFFFSGHGAVGNFFVNGGNNGTFLPHTTLRNILNASKAQKKICIADACHSGSWEKAKKELANTGKALSNDDMMRLYYSSLTNAGNGLALFMSCQEDEISIDDPEYQQGLFTYYYIEGLKGFADTNRDKIITIEELYNYVKDKVSERGITRWKNPQTPKLKGTFDHDMPVGVRD